MSETPAASAAEPGVVASSFDAGETFSKQYVEDLKAKLEAKTTETATLNAKFSAHQDRQRAALKGMQSEVEGFVEEAYNMAPDEVKHEIDPMRQFAKSLGDNANPESAMPLARVICLSSGKFKRERSEFSKSSEMAEQLAEANKKIDELTSDRDGKVGRISELELLADERQEGLEKLQGVLAAKGMLESKFDFSKATSREANASTDIPAAPSAVPREPMAFASDPLMDFLSGGSSSAAGGRLMPSNTSHGFLGAVAGSSSDGGVSEALRGL